jgi:DNA repair photolyase
MSDKIDGKWKTWNPVIGCLHECSYCWAKKFALERLSNTQKYKDGFAPKLAENELSKKFRNQFVFVSDMGDLFGEWVPRDWILQIIDATKNSPSSEFLFLTKNPSRYKDFVHLCPENVVLGATIETNRLHRFSKAPPVTERARAMTDLSYKRKFVSIEPILDFDIDIFTRMIEGITPEQVAVCYDNWKNRLPEPSLSKTVQFMDRLNEFTKVRKRTLRQTYAH